jgi:hypothetical protein
MTEVKVREPIRLPNDLYDRAMQAARERQETIHDLGENAVRFWMSIISSGGDESRMTITAEENQMLTALLGFIRGADPDLVAAVSHIVENWRIKQRMPRQ